MDPSDMNQEVASLFTDGHFVLGLLIWPMMHTHNKKVFTGVPRLTVKQPPLSNASKKVHLCLFREM